MSILPILCPLKLVQCLAYTGIQEILVNNLPKKKNKNRITNHSTYTQLLPILSEVKPSKKTQAHYFILLNLIQLQTSLGTAIIIYLKNKN